jgi:two-component system CheB/CheR fusion protein
MTVGSGGKPKEGESPGKPESMDSAAKSERSKAHRRKWAWFYEIVQQLGVPGAVLDHSHCMLFVNLRFHDLYATGGVSLIGNHIRNVAGGVLYTLDLRDALGPEKTSSEGGRIRIDVRARGGQRMAATVWRLPSVCSPAEALLILDASSETILAEQGRRMPATETQPAVSSVLSADTLHHDVRQPLQTLSLLQGVLAMREEDASRRSHIERLREAIVALTGMLDVLHDLHHSTAAGPAPRLVDFPIEPVLSRLRSEFAYHAEVKGLKLRGVSSRAVVHSDLRSLEQLMRTLLLVAVKMTSRGKVLLGCRRRRGDLRIEIWIEGEVVGLRQQQDMLDEFHRDTPLLDKIGVVQSIVRPLANSLGVSVRARSRPGTGLLFTADVPMSPTSHSDLVQESAVTDAGAEKGAARGVVAAVSAGPSDNRALKLLLQEAGFQVVTVSHDGDKVEVEAAGGMQPEVIVANFPRLSNGLADRVIRELRNFLGQQTPVLMICDEAWRASSSAIDEPITYLNRLASAEEIASRTSQSLRIARDHLAQHRIKEHRSSSQTTFIVDDDRLLLDAMSSLLKARGEHIEMYSSAESFLESYDPSRRGCLVVDDMLPGQQGIELIERLNAEGATLPAIVITGHGNVATAVRAMKAGAIDYIEKPVHHDQLMASIDRALEVDKAYTEVLSRRQELAARYATLTRRERQVMKQVAKGASSKVIARILNISQRTVESHRAAAMKRMGATSLSELIHAVMELDLPQDQ